jgi:hypothetical protein
LIAVNPFMRLPHLYNEYMMEQYKGVRLGDLSPHVFAVADASYRWVLHSDSVVTLCYCNPHMYTICLLTFIKVMQGYGE